MSERAYRDKARTQLVYACNCTINDKHLEFFCTNPKCDAVMRLRCLHSVRKPNFYGLNHIGVCANKTTSVKNLQYDEENFSIESIFANLSALKNSANRFLTHSKNAPKTGYKKRRALSTLPQIYDLCKSLSYDEKYNNVEIRDILVDNRCNASMAEDISGTKLIECSFYRYVTSENQIFFRYPLDQGLKNKFLLRLDFTESADFKKIEKNVYNTNNFPIVIFGDWKLVKESVYACEFISDKQLYFPTMPHK